MDDILVRPTLDQDYPLVAALGYLREQETMCDDYLRIGDSSFLVPPLSISVHEKTNNHVEDVLRTPGGIVMANGFAEKEITIELRFTTAEEIFGLAADYQLLNPKDRQLGDYQASPEILPASLAALIAQFKRNPILPVRNVLLNSTHDIQALALTSLLVETCLEDDGTPLPNCLKVTVQAMAFAYYALCPTLIDFDQAIIWPLYRWNWRQQYAGVLPGEFGLLAQGTVQHPSLTQTERTEASAEPDKVFKFARYPHQSGMTGDFQFSIVSHDWLDSLNGLRAEYNKWQAYTLSDAFRSYNLQSQRQAAFGNLSDLAKAIQTLSEESYARMEVKDFGPDLILTHMAAQITNNFATLRVPSVETPVYQHMSQGDVRLVATFWATDAAVVSELENMIRQTRDLARDSRFEMVAGFVGFENEIASLMGVRSVVFTDVQTRTIEGLPNNYLISIEMIAFDRTQRKIESVQAAAGGDAGSAASYYLDQNPLRGSGESYPSADPRRAFWARYRAQYDVAHDPSQPSGSHNPNDAFDPLGRPTNAWFNMAYIQQAKEQMAALELYPDLQLPTWERLSSALTGGEIFPHGSLEETAQYQLQKLRWTYWTKQGRFVDPDFYVDYPNRALASKILPSPTVPSFSVDPNPLDGTKSGPNQTGTNMSYLAQGAAAMANLDATQQADLLQIDGSISDGLKGALFDTYPQGGLFGPDLTGDTNMAGESGVLRGNDTLHMAITMPHAQNKHKTSVGQMVFNEHRMDEPDFNDQLSIDDKIYGVSLPRPRLDWNEQDPYAYKQIKGLPESLADAHKIITGKGAPAGTEQMPDLQPALMAHHPIDIGVRVADEHQRCIAMCMDTFDNDQSGRLVQAYPAYIMQLVDEGPRMGWVKLFPNFFALQSVQSIDIISDRREPADTAIIELMNTYGNLSSYTQLQQTLNAYTSLISAGNATWQTTLRTLGDFAQGVGDIGHQLRTGQIGPNGQTKATVNTENTDKDLEMWWEGIENVLNAFIPQEGLVRNIAEQRRKQSGAIMLEPGVRVHLRMGYGGNGASFPILFNGRITDIGHGERVRVVAMGDGMELDKLIPTAESETNSINRPDRNGFQELAVLSGAIFGDGLQHAAPGTSQGAVVGAAIGGMFRDYSKLFDITYEPREIILQMLNSHGEELFDYSLGTKFWNMIKTNIRTSTNGAHFFDNPIGITHFGNPYLFNLWRNIAGQNSLDQINENTVVAAPQPLASYDDGKACVLGTKPGTTTETLMKHSEAGLTYDPGNGGFAQIIAGGEVTRRMGELQGGPLGVAEQIGGIALKLIGEAATLSTQEIQVGYGETGENVYAIYTPFSKLLREIGSMTSETGLAKIAGVEDPEIPELPSLATAGTYSPLQGAHPPGVGFNMYTKNKTVWDIVTSLGQYFPPYIAAVRPFEYRSTLFFGAPYFTYRYDYKRVDAMDLGQFGDASHDRFYGYPVGYKTKPFMQFHVYDSKINLLDNNIRASDEDTYTDVIAMWYKGQGVSGSRPTPKPVHQTVDRMVAPAFKKTAIINTDVLGIDTAPTPGAMISVVPLLGYWAEHFLEVPWTDIGVHGAWNDITVTPNVRQMARAILRDYQKLMYQGQILVIGDPSVKPHDLAFINDDYQDIRGPVGVRRVIHHFSADTGFVTSIEPDLCVEVKGQNYLTSIKTWLAGFAAPSLVSYMGAKIIAAKARRRLIRQIFEFGLKLVKKTDKAESSLGKLAERLGLPEQFADKVKDVGTDLFAKRIETYEPRALISYVRSGLLEGLNRLLQGNGKVAAAGQKLLGSGAKDFTALAKDITAALKDSGHPFGARVERTAAAHIQAEVDKLLEKGLAHDGAEAIRRAVAHNLIQGTGDTLLLRDLPSLVNRATTEYIASSGLLRFLEGNKSLVGIGDAAVSIDFKAAGEAFSLLRSATASIAEKEKAAATLGKFWNFATKASVIVRINPAALAFQIAVGWIWTSISRWWDDETSLEMIFLTYRGQELQAGLNGHQDAIVLRSVPDDTVKALNISPADLKRFAQPGFFNVRPEIQALIKMIGSSRTGDVTSNGITAGTSIDPRSGQTQIGTGNPLSTVRPVQSKYSLAERTALADYHRFSNPTNRSDFINLCQDNLIGLFDRYRQLGLRVDVSCFQTLHTAGSCQKGAHGHGRAADMTSVNDEQISGSGLSGQWRLLVNQTALYAATNWVGVGSIAGSYPNPNGKVGVDTNSTGPHIHVQVNL